MLKKLHPEATIERLATSVYDNGRRGSPKPGCDCVQCFGYCMVNTDVSYREIRLRVERAAVVSDSVLLPDERDAHRLKKLMEVVS